MFTRDEYCTREIKMRIFIAKEAFNRKMSLLKCNKHLTLEEIDEALCLEHILTLLRDLETKKIGEKEFGELSYWVLVENGEHKMVRESKL